MAAKLTRLTDKIAIRLHLMAENCTICSYRSRWLVRTLLDTISYFLSHGNPAVVTKEQNSNFTLVYFYATDTDKPLTKYTDCSINSLLQKKHCAQIA